MVADFKITSNLGNIKQLEQTQLTDSRASLCGKIRMVSSAFTTDDTEKQLDDAWAIALAETMEDDSNS